MGKSRIAKQIVAETENKVGMLADVTDAVAGSGANIQTICAYAMGDKAVFYLITDNNQKALSGLKSKGYGVKEEDVVVVDLVNEVGSASSLAKKLKDAGIDLSYIYGSAGEAKESLIVFKSDNNAKAVTVIG
ncbi:MAG: hypothetical protein ISS34_05460 [Candidatus Omnitrophica bacterium]|nr:hypothetical protein [Candidatus Omnitrophota bacterium]